MIFPTITSLAITASVLSIVIWACSLALGASKTQTDFKVVDGAKSGILQG